MAFMMSKEQLLANQNPHWHPHLMFFVANVNDTTWGANFAGSPVLTSVNGSDPITMFFIPIGNGPTERPTTGQPSKAIN